MANDFTFTQLSSILNAMAQQATGRASIAPINTSQFVTVGQTLLKQGYDPVLNAISVVLTKTIFSIRPYQDKFGGLQVDNQKFGAITRKLKISDRDWEDDQRFELVEDESVDMFKVRKPKILQINYYGQNIYQRHYTLFKDQLDTAFRSPDEFGRFVTMVVTNCRDIINQKREMVRRATLGNLIVGRATSTPENVIHLIQEYNQVSGSALTPQTVFAPENFKPFILWVYARIEQISKLMTERSTLFQTNLTGHEALNQHTPVNRQRVFMYAPYRAMIDSMALSEVFHQTALKMRSGEQVSFWQNINDPSSINIDATYLQSDGTLASTGAVKLDNVFGVIFDEEAAGVTEINAWSGVSPFNVAGGYSNYFFHFTERFWNDFTEKSVVLLLD